MLKPIWMAAVAATFSVAGVAQAQTADALPPVPAPAPSDAPADCELHVWPTENYVGMNSGLLSGFGPLGALADMDAHKGRVQTVKDLMRDYLGPDVQIEELNKIGLQQALKLDGYRIVIEDPTPFNEDVKKDPALKAKVKVMNAKLKGGDRLSDSTAPCYAELVGTMIFYQKAMMYGSNLFSAWVFRKFPATGKATVSKAGWVKNPLEDFPPKTDEKVEAAKIELRDAYSKDFLEYLQKKVFQAEAK